MFKVKCSILHHSTYYLVRFRHRNLLVSVVVVVVVATGEVKRDFRFLVLMAKI